MKSILQLSGSQIVLLGVLSQVGLGIFQYPTTFALNKAQKYGISVSRLDVIMNIVGTLLFVLPMLGIGAILFLANGQDAFIVESNRPVNLALLGLFFTMWGQAAGTTWNTCSTVINFNHQENNPKRRKRVAILSLNVGLGAVFFVCFYFLVLSHRVPLYDTFFGLAIWFSAVLGSIRLVWMQRVFARECTQPEHEVEREEAVPLVMDAIQQQPLSALLRNDIVWFTMAGTFVGVGVGGTFMSSIGNLGQELEPVNYAFVTFYILLAFLVGQTLGRLGNAIFYAFYDWPFVFAFWQVFCGLGIVIFVVAPTIVGAFVSAALVGASFGGFHSCFPILAATCFPGNHSVDYSQSVGLLMFMSSMGAICVGQIATVVYESASLEDLHNPGWSLHWTFVFFLSVQALSALSSIVLGFRIRRMRLNKEAQVVVVS